MTARYSPVTDGFRIVGGSTRFNRALYGGHEQDNLSERYFTFAGDAPIVMGAVTDWRKRNDGTLAKCGTLMMGVAKTPGISIPIMYYAGETDGDRYGQWFHDSPGTITTFRNGWMEHEVHPFFQCFPSVRGRIEVLPLSPEAGFLVRLAVSTDQHVHLAVAFGGITDFLGRLDQLHTSARNFSPDHCRGNRIACGPNRALVEGMDTCQVQTTMWLGTSFDAEVSVGDGRRIATGVGSFLARETHDGSTPVVRIKALIEAGRTLEGFVVVLRNANEAALDRWLAKFDPAGELKRAIRAKHDAIEVRTPDPRLDLTVPPTVIALDACWHDNTFCHGAYAWHCPYMGWRNWYGPTVIGWHNRVARAIRTHAATQVQRDPAAGPEEVEQTFGQCARLKNSYGFIPEIPDGRKTIFYNMQEVYVDHVLHHLEWTHDRALVREVFPVVRDVLDWEARILDPDNDGLYQNWLNTWISDAHSYNGGGCAQSSAYNYRANATMAKLAKILGLDGEVFAERARRIRRACEETLWLPDRGILAEYVDTIGKKLVHPAPELATAYHAIEAGLVDPFQARTMLHYTETDIRNERTALRNGRLAWSSNWYPQNYSSCGLYTAENLHLAWAYFRHGLAEQGWQLLTGIVDGYFLSDQPGMASHCMTPSGYTASAQDFTEILSMHLRLIVEGLFGVRFNLLDGQIEIAPNFPRPWDQAKLTVPDLAMEYRRKGNEETFTLRCDTPARRVFQIPLRGTQLNGVELNGQTVSYRINPGIGRSYLVVETDRPGELTLRVRHGAGTGPRLKMSRDGNFSCSSGTVVERKRGSDRMVFVRVREGDWDGWLAGEVPPLRPKRRRRATAPSGSFVPVDLSAHYNIALCQIHNQKYRHPRPAGYSIMTQENGRFGWDWNQIGYAKVVVDDHRLRTCGGTFTTPSGVPFFTPSAGPNAACASIWENFPEALTIPLAGRGSELAVLLVGITNPMQARVDNARLIAEYTDGSEQAVSLVSPDNFDDWLVNAVQTQNETVYFSDANHAIVQRIDLDPRRELKALRVRAVANEVIVGVLGLALRR